MLVESLGIMSIELLRFAPYLVATIYSKHPLCLNFGVYIVSIRSYMRLCRLDAFLMQLSTSNSANVDSIVLNVTKDRGPCAACKTTHSIEVLISIFYMYTLSTSMVRVELQIMRRTQNFNSKLVTFSTMPSMCCMPSRHLRRLDAPLSKPCSLVPKVHVAEVTSHP